MDDNRVEDWVVELELGVFDPLDVNVTVDEPLEVAGAELVMLDSKAGAEDDVERGAVFPVDV